MSTLGSYTYRITSPTTMTITNNQRIKRIPICNILVDLTFTSINTNNVYLRVNIPYKVNRSKDDPDLIESITIFMYDLIRNNKFTKEARQFLGVPIEVDTKLVHHDVAISITVLDDRIERFSIRTIDKVNNHNSGPEEIRRF